MGWHIARRNSGYSNEDYSGQEATMRCCVFKERAIVSEQVKMAMGGNPDNDNVIESGDRLR